jgi:CBS domain containing-hemolysin-like protein
MRKNKSRQAVVLDEFGGVSGLVTVENILAEVLGRHTAEYVPGQPEPERLADGRIRLPGTMRLHESEEWLSIRLEGESDTIGGFVVSRTGYLPVPGESFDLDGVRFEVERVENRMIVSLLVTPKQEPEVEA